MNEMRKVFCGAGWASSQVSFWSPPRRAARSLVCHQAALSERDPPAIVPELQPAVERHSSAARLGAGGERGADTAWRAWFLLRNRFLEMLRDCQSRPGRIDTDPVNQKPTDLPCHM